MTDHTAPDRPAPPSRGQRIGAAVKALRERAGITQQDLAAAVDAHLSTISHLEQGDREKPNRRLVAALAGYFGVSVAELERGEPPPPRPTAPVEIVRTTLDVSSEDELIERSRSLPPGKRAQLLRAWRESLILAEGDNDLARRN